MGGVQKPDQRGQSPGLPPRRVIQGRRAGGLSLPPLLACSVVRERSAPIGTDRQLPPGPGPAALAWRQP